jgi:hypothetical protein
MIYILIDIHIYLCFSCIWQPCFCLTILDICDVNILSYQLPVNTHHDLKPPEIYLYFIKPWVLSLIIYYGGSGLEEPSARKRSPEPLRNPVPVIQENSPVKKNRRASREFQENCRHQKTRRSPTFEFDRRHQMTKISWKNSPSKL